MLGFHWNYLIYFPDRVFFFQLKISIFECEPNLRRKEDDC
jgi:hypothetical protein